jgi:hypothetical protein
MTNHETTRRLPTIIVFLAPGDTPWQHGGTGELDMDVGTHDEAAAAYESDTGDTIVHRWDRGNEAQNEVWVITQQAIDDAAGAE